jgi:redox-sensitive bicupin YhaK (pirin superfamily)
MFYLARKCEPARRSRCLQNTKERGFYLVQASISRSDRPWLKRHLAFLPQEKPGGKATARSRLMLLGGDKADGPRHIWWNFVASSKEQHRSCETALARAAFRRSAGRNEFIPLPER